VTTAIPYDGKGAPKNRITSSALRKRIIDQAVFSPASHPTYIRSVSAIHIISDIQERA